MDQSIGGGEDKVFPTAIVPCPHGYFLLRPAGLEVDEKVIRQISIVAWRVNGDTAWPITADEGIHLPLFEEDETAIQFPDGRVERDNTSWSDVRSYMATYGYENLELDFE